MEDDDGEFFVLSDDEGHAHGVLARDGKLQPGCLHRVAEGRPIPEGADVVRIAGRGPRGELKLKTILRGGPPRASTPAYRAGYDAVFGAKRDVGLN